MNTSIKFEKRPSDYQEVLMRTETDRDGREFDITKRLESLVVRCGPYDNSDYIRIEHDADNGEIRVLVPGEGSEEECVFSIMEETV